MDCVFFFIFCCFLVVIEMVDELLDNAYHQSPVGVESVVVP